MVSCEHVGTYCAAHIIWVPLHTFILQERAYLYPLECLFPEGTLILSYTRIQNPRKGKNTA